MWHDPLEKFTTRDYVRAALLFAILVGLFVLFGETNGWPAP